MGGSSLTASAYHGHKSDISKSSMSPPRTYGYEEERGRGGYERMGRYDRDRYDAERSEQLTPREREHVRNVIREGLARLTPREREHFRMFAREGFERLTPREREHFRNFVLGRLERDRYGERGERYGYRGERYNRGERYGYRGERYGYRGERGVTGYVPDRYDGVSRYNRGERYGYRYERDRYRRHGGTRYYGRQ
jgi:hypothetical protein